jgi:hypothetical protein
MLAPLIPVLKEQGAASYTIALLIAVYPVMKAAGYAACLSPLAARWPVGLLMLIGAGAYSAMAFSLVSVVIAMARATEGFVFGWYMASTSASLARQGGRAGERLGWLNAASSMGVFLGPVLVGATSAIGLPPLAFAVAAIACCAAAFLLRGDRQRAPAAAPKLSRCLFQDGAMVMIAALFALFDFTYGALSFLLPMALTKEFGARAPLATACLFSGSFLIFAGALPIFGRLADKSAPQRMTVLALLGISLTFAAVGGCLEGSLFLVGMVIEYILAAAAYAFSLCLLSRTAQEGFSLVGILQSCGMAAGSLCVERLFSAYGLSVAFLCLGALYLIAALGTASMRMKVSARSSATQMPA